MVAALVLAALAGNATAARGPTYLETATEERGCLLGGGQAGHEV